MYLLTLFKVNRAVNNENSVFSHVILIIALSVTLGNCGRSSDNEQKGNNQIKTDEAFKYSPYFEHKHKQWNDLDAAMQQPKFFGTIEASRFANQTQTAEQKAAADDFFNAVVKNVEENAWFDIDQAKKAGYVYEPAKDFSHFPNYTYLFDNEDLNPKKPEYLMFHTTSEGRRVLTGVMFMLEDLYAHGEQIGGPETVWHFHDYTEEEGGGRCDVYFKIPEGHKYASQVDYKKCKDGIFVTRSPEMMHVWFVDHQEGRFGTTMMIGDEVVKTSRFFSQTKGEW